MPINRTYQGKVLEAHWVKGNKHERTQQHSDKELAKSLKTHLSIYHCAIDYYLACFAALAQGSEVESLQNLHLRVKEAWDGHTYRRGGDGKGFKALLKKHLPHLIQDNMSFQDACDTLIERREGNEQTLHLALEALLHDLGGGSSIQQAGRSYLPYFCNPNTNANYPRSSLILQRDNAKKELPPLLYQADETDSRKLRDNYCLHHFVNLNPSADPKSGEQTRDLLISFNQHLSDEKIITAQQAADNETAINELDIDELSFPSYMGASAKGAEKNRFYAFALFKLLPYSSDRFATLRSTYPEPQEAKGQKKISAQKQKELEYEAHLQSLGEDPILLARGERNYIFQSFSSRFSKQARSESPAWIELDISAFKEALKTLNQIEQKTTERLNLLEELQSKVQFYKQGKGSAANPDEPVTFAKDPRLGENLQLWQDLKEQATSEATSEFGTNTIRHRSIKGWRDLRPKLQRYIDRHPNATQQDIIDNVWNPFQTKNKNIGDTLLFHTLADPKYHPLWKEIDDSETTNWLKNQWSHDLITDLVHYDTLLTDVEDLKANLHIKLTPAHIKHSRRPIMLSDFTGSSKVVHLSRDEERPSLVTSIYAKKNDSTDYTQERIELCYSAPRLLRDNISGSENRTLLQPLVKGLGLETPDPKTVAPKPKELAVALMPDFAKKHSKKDTRFLLNFPAQLNTEWISNQLGKEIRWKGQFVGTKDEHLYLQWPETIRKGIDGWWTNPEIIANGFTVFSVDLGLKTAAAYTTLKIVCDTSKIPKNKDRYKRMIGHDGTRQWFAYPVARGTLRLPGEDAKVLRPEKTKSSDKSLKRKTEFGGSTGRKATNKETEEFLQQIDNIQKTLAEQNEGLSKRLIEDAQDKTPEHIAAQNDLLLKAVKQVQGHLSNMHYILALSKRDDLLEVNPDELNDRQKKRLESAIQIKTTGDHTQTENYISNLQNQLKQLLTFIANGVLPQRDFNWVIKQGEPFKLNIGEEKTDFTPYSLVREQRSQGEKEAAHHSDESARMIRYQRGLSASRIEQLEDLRRRMSSLQRELNRAPGEEMKIGYGRFSGNIPETCPEILEKLDNLKDQRVKQTAHLILTQALALRLKKQKTPSGQRADYLHGEYEKIPGAECSDFIVIEDLNRYLTTQGKTKAENRKLMQWSHRAIAGTLKELCEPFGIPLVTAAAGYSSRFCATTSRPGFRATTITQKNLDHFILNKFREKDADPLEKKLADQIDNALQNNPNKHLQLLIPTDGGTMFVPVVTDKKDRNDFPVSQADINASHNVGLRAIAAPSRLDILHKLRVIGAHKPRRDNIREKNAYTTKQTLTPTQGEFSKEIRGKKYTNFFHLGSSPLPVKQDKATLSDSAEHIASGLGLWKYVKDERLNQCYEINKQRLE